MAQTDIDARFTYRKPTEEETAAMTYGRELARDYAEFIVDNTMPGREQSLALTKLDEVVFWTNAAVVRGGSD